LKGKWLGYLLPVHSTSTLRPVLDETEISTRQSMDCFESLDRLPEEILIV
jgi:hypothetical protein